MNLVCRNKYGDVRHVAGSSEACQQNDGDLERVRRQKRQPLQSGRVPGSDRSQTGLQLEGQTGTQTSCWRSYSFIILLLAVYHAQHQKKVCIVVPNTLLTKQMRQDLDLYVVAHNIGVRTV